ncbi:NAD-dependent epimerase/dehydratase family protein [Maribacter sp. R77961]|uniref:NAD-dependent epimerase/dehydratase family protein n=1 Tax=Maribacter sp. R77961 TaxID=3093871 RepID=UPI0037CCA771
MKILITGAAGFIGFHLAESLSKKGEDIIGIDNINDYYNVQLKYDRLAQAGISISKLRLKKNRGNLNYLPSSKYDNYCFLKLDITDLKSLETLFEEHKFDCVINLAAQAGVRYSIENPHAYIQSNIVGFLNILECCRQHEIEHLIYASSSSVYGNRSNVPFSESDPVDEPVSLYAATKKSNELMAYSYSHLYDLQTTGLRFFTVYGPWGRPDMAPILFADAINTNSPINVFNNGNMERDFTFIDDVVEGIVRLTLTSATKKDSKARIFNIGNSSPIKLMDFITGLEKQMGKRAVKNFMPMQDGDVRITYADSSKLKSVIEYEPKTKLSEGLFKFTQWYKRYYNN